MVNLVIGVTCIVTAIVFDREGFNKFWNRFNYIVGGLNVGIGIMSVLI